MTFFYITFCFFSLTVSKLNVGFCHPAQFFVAHILRVDWMENQITEIYQKLLMLTVPLQTEGHFYRQLLRGREMWLTTSEFQWAGMCIHWKIFQVHWALSVNGQPEGGRQMGGGIGGFLLMTSHHHMHIVQHLMWKTNSRQDNRYFFLCFFLACGLMYKYWSISSTWNQRHTT